HLDVGEPLLVEAGRDARFVEIFRILSVGFLRELDRARQTVRDELLLTQGRERGSRSFNLRFQSLLVRSESGSQRTARARDLAAHPNDLLLLLLNPAVCFRIA